MIRLFPSMVGRCRGVSRYAPAAMLAMLLPLIAYADTPQTTLANFGTVLGFRLPLSLAGGCTAIGGGGRDFACIGEAVVANLRPALVIFAVFIVALTGFNMIVRQEEELQTKSRKIIASVLSGVMLSYLIGPFIDSFYGLATPGSVPNSGLVGGATVLSREVTGIINFVLVITGVLTIFLIIISGVRAIVTAGSEEGLTQLKRTIGSIIAGILLIILREVLAQAFGLTGVALPSAPGLAAVGGKIIIVINYFLGFLGLIALIVFVYAGFSMVLSIGVEEQITKAKSLMLRAVIGIALILMSLTIVRFVIGAF